MLASESKSPRAMPESTQPNGPETTSRADVARSLEGKDPSWFRQTADRGNGSAAFRRNQEDDPTNTGDSVRLPGLSPAMDQKSEEANTRNSRDADKRSSGESTITKGTLSTIQSSTTNTFSSRSKSPLPLLSSQRLEPSQREGASPLSADTSPLRGLAMSPSQRSLSPERTERPSSPTKGLGGFVQSAMLKRSDSINKHMRAGSQATASLSRSNSVISTRNENMDEPIALRAAGAEDNGGFVKPALPSRAQSHQQEKDQFADSADATLPIVSSRTMDSRRWSPTKTTWLESAIQKTDSPKPKPSPQKPPMWLSELQKSKQSATSHDDGRSPSYKQVEIGGFMRSPALGSASKSPGFGGFPAPSVSDKAPSLARASSFPNEPKDNPQESFTSNTSGFSDKEITVQSSPGKTEEPLPSPSDRKKTTNGSQSPRIELGTRKTSAGVKPKPETPPKKNFRANLKSYEPGKDKSADEEPEFKNMFGKLKKAETKNYIAPDELRGNIARGKAGLATTGGPRKYEKRDDFRDSLLKKKEAMKTDGSIRGKPTPTPKPSDYSLPEAIARQRGLGTQDSTATPPAERPKPEAPQKQSSMQIEPPKFAPIEKKTSAPGRLQIGAGGLSNGLAERFNPSLPGTIARGPSAVSAGEPPAHSKSPRPAENEERLSGASQSSQLTHATKSRARGPKRRLPQVSKTSDSTSTPDTSTKPATESTGTADRKSSFQPKPPEIRSPKPSMETLTLRTASSDTAPSSCQTRSSNPSVGKLASSAVVSDNQNPTTYSPRPLALPSKPEIQSRKPQLAPSNLSPTIIPKIPPALKLERNPSETQSQDIPTKPATPISSRAATKNRSLLQESPKSPPIPSNKPKALARIASNSLSSPQIREPKPDLLAGSSHSSPSKVFSGFFDNSSSQTSKAGINAHALLSGVASGEGKIKTLRKEIWELGADGKKTPLAAHQEHILFEDKMYLCKHVFGSSNGKRITEVYLWCGDQVSQSAVEDAQLFARNEARDAGGKLQALAQGKESSNFFEALGGIVITRRNSAATYTLCGRRHMGQIAFDEVDHSQASLCSGFPFIVAATGGHVYLWKGKGANADELGCARLIGMDLGLTSEIDEVDEGNEPRAFLGALKPSGNTSPLTEHWLQKGSVGNYETRLFAIDTDARPKSASSFTGLFTRRPSAPSNEDASGQIKEISPYSQADIARDGIYMLDAFFEIYM